ncbi:hypothetical protein OIU93_17755 [Paeniglutamicibacter sp. ZC-3]|uniref:hypothetical protein n=1 Tax=Paeniglutamicibacter sp. ZC-3 TaxID=2986919 RepID=UPI0021F76693|nr:hypothetical protein [Paeniglutamicibacter sp. ZC-3]MCV9996129.1 hypothetical protein [Paeniglutamicibacter sp. ZC-3]
MSDGERVAWVTVASAGLGMLAFAVVVLLRILDGSLAGDQPFSFPMIGCMFLIVVPIWVTRAVLLKRNAGTNMGPDERDRDIVRRADQTKFGILLMACVVVLALAFNGSDHFWIASAVFAGLGLSFLGGAAVQINGYRRGIPAG